MRANKDSMPLPGCQMCETSLSGVRHASSSPLHPQTPVRAYISLQKAKLPKCTESYRYYLSQITATAL